MLYNIKLLENKKKIQLNQNNKKTYLQFVISV